MASTNGKKLRFTAPARRGCIEIRGARQNNLKGFDLDLPLGELTVVTGPSGSGKSSLAFDTIYAEGQRRYVETFCPYTRQFLERMDKPRVDEIRGIPPAIAIEQSNPVKSLALHRRHDDGDQRLPEDALAARGARILPELRARDPAGDREVDRGSRSSPRESRDKIRRLITSGWPCRPKTEPRDFFAFLQQQGYLRVWLNGEIVRADTERKESRLGARVQVIQDRI